MSAILSKSSISLNINLQDIYAEEDEDNVVYSIREEIIQNVITEIDRISLEKRLIRFVSECACDALKKMISIQFYYRAAIPDFRYPPWVPDLPAGPSPPDTWATKRVPIQPRSKTVVQEEEIEETAEKICTCDLGVKCLCCLEALDRIKSQLELLYMTTKSKVDTLSSPRSPRTTLTETLESEELEEEEEEPEQEIVETIEAQESEKCILKEGFSKIGIAINTVKLPKIELPPPMIRETTTEILELPPIRVDANFQSRPVEAPKKKQANKKKK